MTSPNFSCINAPFLMFATTNHFMFGKKVTLKKAALGALIFTIFFFKEHEKEAKGKSSIQSKVTTRSSKECCRSIQSKAALKFLPTPSLTCSVHQSYVWHMNIQS